MRLQQGHRALPGFANMFRAWTSGILWRETSQQKVRKAIDGGHHIVKIVNESGGVGRSGRLCTRAHEGRQGAPGAREGPRNCPASLSVACGCDGEHFVRASTKYVKDQGFIGL